MYRGVRFFIWIKHKDALFNVWLKLNFFSGFGEKKESYLELLIEWAKN